MRAFLLDRDGVLNPAKGSAAHPDAVAWVRKLQQRGIPFLVATNQTTSSPAEVHASLVRQGFVIGPEQVHTPLSILFDTFEADPPRRIYVRGTDALKAFLSARGLEVVDDPKVDTVVFGFDRAMTYGGISKAIEAVFDHGARLVALHENNMFRNPEGHLEPGLGAWVRAVEYATGTTALVIGKPSRAYYETALAKLGTSAQDTTMVSDDPVGDLVGAKRMGMHTVFVLSGKYQDRSVLSSEQVCHQPDEVFEALHYVPFE